MNDARPELRSFNYNFGALLYKIASVYFVMYIGD